MPSPGGDSKDLHEAAKSKVAAMQASVKSASAPAHPAAVPELHTAAPAAAAAAPAAAPKAAAADNDGFGKINMGNMGGMGMMGSMMPGMGGGDGKGNKGGTYGVMKKVGAEFGLGSLVGKNKKDPNAKPVGKAILDDLKVRLFNHPHCLSVANLVGQLLNSSVVPCWCVERRGGALVPNSWAAFELGCWTVLVRLVACVLLCF